MSSDDENSAKASEPGVELSDTIITPLDLGKIQRELFAIDRFLTAGSDRSPGGKMPYSSPELKQIIDKSTLNLLKAEDRTQLINRLQFVRRTAPKVQISFASEPSKQALRPLVRWFRENGHPNTLISVGVQPSIAGGCVVRTASKEFDFSLQKYFKESSPILAQNLAVSK